MLGVIKNFSSALTHHAADGPVADGGARSRKRLRHVLKEDIEISDIRVRNVYSNTLTAKIGELHDNDIIRGQTHSPKKLEAKRKRLNSAANHINRKISYRKGPVQRRFKRK